MQPRNIVLNVILTVVTCGIFGIVWWFQLGGDIQALRGDDKPPTLRDFVLCLVTCGIWGYFVAYQWPIWLQEPLRKRGRHVDPNLPVLCLVLAFFGLHIVTLVLMQQAANDAMTAPVQ
jgi:apolipoprotein N-acyltransferase